VVVGQAMPFRCVVADAVDMDVPEVLRVKTTP
jgi:hypothetical protein